MGASIEKAVDIKRKVKLAKTKAFVTSKGKQKRSIRGICDAPRIIKKQNFR